MPKFAKPMEIGTLVFARKIALHIEQYVPGFAVIA